MQRPKKTGREKESAEEGKREACLVRADTGNSAEGTEEYGSWGRALKRSLLHMNDNRDVETRVPLQSDLRAKQRRDAGREEGERQTEPEEMKQSCLAGG